MAENKRYAMVIDIRRCIACHACTVACKAEMAVPLEVNATWLKIVEKGTYPGRPAFLAPAPLQQLHRRHLRPQLSHQGDLQAR